MAEIGTKERIIRRAIEMFEARGYDAVTVNDICAECGITKPTFYYHMAAKEQIISDYYRDVVQNLPSALLAMVGQRDAWQQALFFFDTLIDTSARLGPELYGRMYMMNLKEDLHTFDLSDTLTDMMVNIVAAAQSQGVACNRSDAHRLYLAAAHTFEGYELMWCIKKGGFDRKAHLHRALEDILDIVPDRRDAGLGSLALKYE